MNDTAQIQIQDITGNWITISHTQNQAQNIKIRLDEAIKRSPTGRARAITQSGSLIDLKG